MGSAHFVWPQSSAEWAEGSHSGWSVQSHPLSPSLSFFHFLFSLCCKVRLFSDVIIVEEYAHNASHAIYIALHLHSLLRINFKYAPLGSQERRSCCQGNILLRLIFQPSKDDKQLKEKPIYISVISNNRVSLDYGFCTGLVLELMTCLKLS